MLTMKEAAERLGYKSEATIRNLRDNGKIKVERVIEGKREYCMVPEEEVERLLSERGATSTQDEEQVASGNAAAVALFQGQQEVINSKDNKITELYERIAQLESRCGRLEGERDQMLERYLELKEERRKSIFDFLRKRA